MNPSSPRHCLEFLERYISILSHIPCAVHCDTLGGTIFDFMACVLGEFTNLKSQQARVPEQNC
jgi:hypothetical protein